MKRVWILWLVITLLMSNPLAAYAMPTDFNGGVNDEYEYEEWVFVSGKALKFVGDITITEKDKNTQKTLSYKFQLKPEDKSISGKLDRKVSYTINYNSYNDKGQTIADMQVDNYKETITIDGVKYDLDDYQFNKSDVIDNRPASDFSLGTFEARKYYTINKNQGKLTVSVSGGEVGYDNFWGHTQTQIVDYYFDCARTVPAGGGDEDRDGSWQGTVRVNISDSVAKSLRYADNTPVYSSFAGAHMRVTNQEMASIYECDLPRMDEEGIPHEYRREQNTVSLNKQMVPFIEKLIIPKFRDLGGHWAEDYINQLYSLDVFTENSSFFAPDIPMSRMDFIKAVVKACDIRPTSTPTKTRSSARTKTPAEVSPYYDLEASDPDYAYAKAAFEKGIAAGTSDKAFSPEGNLTRVQAVTILIRALGFENIAPTPGYYTTFYDNDQIPGWGIDSVFMAQRIGLITGDSNNRFQPNQAMSKAEAAAMLVRFLEFLHDDLQKDYRENIVLFRS